MSWDSPGWKTATAEYHANRPGSSVESKAEQRPSSNSNGHAPGEIVSLDTGARLDAQEPVFPLIAFADIKLDTEARNYLVKGLLPSGGMVVVWGPPKSGKSFWIMDVALSVATGREYRGRKTQQADVVYIALEGREGIPRRVEAFKQKHGIRQAPFYLMLRPFDLIKDVGALITSIKAQLGDKRPGLFIIDTLNRSLVGSESKDEDMAAYIAAAGKIETEFGCLVIIVHHCGIDATRPRGHTSLTGAVEVQIAVKKTDDGTVVATVERAKDLPEGAEIFSRLEHCVIGKDPDGDDITSLVVVPSEEAFSHQVTKKLSAGQRRCLDALFEVLLDFGTVPPASSHIPAKTRTTTLVRWKEYFLKKTIADPAKPDSKDKAFVRASVKLQDLRIIGVWGDQVWVSGHVGQSRT
jgi:hypothetical protein